MRTARPASLTAAFALAAALLAAPAARADLVVGQTAGFTGPVGASVNDLSDGAKLYLDAINRRGGVHGQKIRLVQLDDKFDPKLAAANAARLLREQQPIALFLTRATPHTQAILPLLAQHRVPLVAPSTGAMVFHEPVNPYVFNVRAPYQREAERAIVHLGTIGLTRIGVLRVDDSFGADAALGARKGFAAIKREPVVVQTFDRAKPDFGPAVQALVAADAQAVLFVGSARAVSDGTAALRNAGSRAQVVTLSNNASGSFAELMGAHARGTIVMQVFPNERSLAAPLVKEAVDLARAQGLDGVSPAMVEGFAAAKVLVEGLQRAGANPTRERLMAALNSMGQVDLGGMDLGFSPTDHTGLEYVDMSIIGRDGRFLR